MSTTALEERLDYGISLTKRPTVPAAEEILGIQTPVLSHGRVQLVDYMGSDQTIINAATNYHGLEAVGNPAPKDFLMWLRSQGIRRPFRFAEVKMNMAMPITAALTVVPFEEASVNEYSGRYSVMSDDNHNPFEANSDAGRRVETMFEQTRQNYHRLIHEDTDLARELARIILPAGNYTQCYWKVSLESLFTFLRENPNPAPELAPYIEQLRLVAQRVAPLAFEAFQAVDENHERYSLEVRVHDSDIGRRARNLNVPYGINETRRLTIPAAEEQMFRLQQVLGQGFVALIDYMGSDESIVQAARVSYGRGTKKATEDAGLIRYLERHLHTTPSEMIELAFIAKLPLIIERQLVRHRTLDKVGFLNGFMLEDDMYIPPKEELRRQSATNKQGRGTELEADLKDSVLAAINETHEAHSKVYQEAEALGHTNDALRHIRPVGSFTNWCIKGDMKNLLHMLGLRLDAHAQKEARVYAEVMAEAVKAVAPVTYQAFLDYRMNGIHLSALEIEALRILGLKEHGSGIEKRFKEVEAMIREKVTNKREFEELSDKIRRLCGQ